MSDDKSYKYLVAVIGAGPAGLFASRQLAEAGVRAVLFNRDIKPGGLAEYGIYPTKYKMKEGLRKQFRRILDIALIDYYGNVLVGQNGDFTLEELLEMGFQAALVTVGAQGTKWLGIPGEGMQGAYHAKDIVYHYNRLPPFSQHRFNIGRRVALVGVGNVMMDLAHWLIREVKVEQVIAVARRGPAEVKFSKNEMEYIAANLDLEAFRVEMQRVAPRMEAVGQSVATARDFILAAIPDALEPVSETRFRFDFLASPCQILGNEDGQVTALEVEDTELVSTNGDTKARSLGTHRTLDVDTVIFCIGDRVDESFGLPVQRNEFVKASNPRFPVEGLSYEAYNPQIGKPIEGVFVAGWSREASSGLVGIARKDGENGAQAVLQYLQTLPIPDNLDMVIQKLHQNLYQLNKFVVTRADWRMLEEVEAAEAVCHGLPEYKFSSNEEMLSAIMKVTE